MKKYMLLPKDRLSHYFEWWDEVLSNHEVGNVFFLPNCDDMYRAHQYLDLRKGEVILINMTQKMIDDGGDLIAELERISGKKDILILAQKMFAGEESESLVEAIAEYNLSSSRGILIIHESAPHEIYRKGRLTTTIFQNQQIYSLYSDSVMEEFVRRLTNEWKVNLDARQIKEIIEPCGGVVWLVKDIVRAIRNEPKLVINDYLRGDNFKWKVERFYLDLPQEFRDALNHKMAEQVIWREMEAFGLVDSQHEVRPKVLQDYINTANVEHTVINQAEIKFKGKDLTYKYSKTEKNILNYLYSRSEEVVTREEIGKLWTGEDGDYSDYALDQKMSRLRRKVKQDKLPIRLVTRKGKGYVCSIS